MSPPLGSCLVYRHAAAATLAYGLPPRPPAGRRDRRRDRHPAVPAGLLVGALAAADLGIDFEGTDFAFLEEWPFLLGVSCSWSLDFADVARRGRDPGPADRVSAARGGGRARRAPGRRIARRPRAEPWPGILGGVRLAALGFAAARSLFARVRARLDPEAPARCPLRRGGARWRPRGSILFPPLAILVSPAPVAAARRPPRAARSTPGCGSCGDQRGRRSSSSVIDAMKPAMLERAVRPGARRRCAADRARPLRRRLRGRVPLGDAGLRRDDRHRDRARTPRIPAMNWYHRGEERYVEYGTSFSASQAFGIRRRSPTRSTT